MMIVKIVDEIDGSKVGALIVERWSINRWVTLNLFVFFYLFFCDTLHF
jgi:hypothetical protein